MQSAFLNFRAKNQDVLPKVDITKSNIELKPIESILKQGNKILIQIKKDGTANKGAKVSTHINISGRFVVLMPDTEIVTVSQKIENEDRRNELIRNSKKLFT